MAVATGLAGPADMVCGAAHASPLSGMAPMYLLMSAVHAEAWLIAFCRARPGIKRAFELA